MKEISTQALMQEIIDRCMDQQQDLEPRYDGILSFLTDDELDWLQGECCSAIDKAIERTESVRFSNRRRSN
jgi:hypothetical protein